jgi:hypothetical protein
MFIAILATATSANAALLISDNFDYPNGNLAGKTPAVGAAWVVHSGDGTLPISVSDGKVSLTHGTGSRDDVNSPLANSLGAGGKLYASFDLTVADPGVAITNAYFAHFLDGTSNFASRVWITAPTSSGYRLALSNNNSAVTTIAGVARTGDLAFGTTYTVVTSYTYDTGTGSMWINPTLETDPSLAATDTPLAPMTIDGYALRQGGGNSVQVIDNLRVGTTFNAVVPEPTSLGLFSLGTLLIGRRRR